jgi:hypothetical protein
MTVCHIQAESRLSEEVIQTKDGANGCHGRFPESPPERNQENWEKINESRDEAIDVQPEAYPGYATNKKHYEGKA